jgi:hypothetical protein
MLKIKYLAPRQAIFMLGGAPTAHEVLPEKSYKRGCPEKIASRRLDADLFSAFSPTE